MARQEKTKNGDRTKRETEREIVAAATRNVSAADDLGDLIVDDSGSGVSDRPEDKFYPIITVLQRQSPQVDDSSTDYVDGAKGGSIWLRNFEVEIVDGREGIVVQPVIMYTEYVEWTPREMGGGMVARYAKPPPAAVIQPDGFSWKMGSNDLRETRVWVVNLCHATQEAPFIIPCQGTLNTFARSWNTMIGQRIISGSRSPAWAFWWRLTTKERSNTKGKWYTLAFEVDRQVSREEYLRGRAMHAAVREALKRGEQIAEAYSRDEPPDANGDTF